MMRLKPQGTMYPAGETECPKCRHGAELYLSAHPTRSDTVHVKCPLCGVSRLG